jgi:serine/threonine-protein kinase HipA
VVVGTLTRAPKTAALAFTYERAWRDDPEAYPLTPTMPLVRDTYAHEPVDLYLQGLLPDNGEVLAALARRHQVAASDAFALLATIGEDCPGAIQFVRPDRVDDVLRGDADGVVWLTHDEVADRLTALRLPGASGRTETDIGQFSLPGRQPKTALLHDPQGDRWGVPMGRVPTTHILKPAPAGYDRLAENEHLCLGLARALGMPAAHSAVLRVGAASAIVVERYDRFRDPGGRLVRVHQVDMCQALGVSPKLKYEIEGGPTAPEIVTFLRERSAKPGEDIDTFIRALGFNWMIYGTDAHARNYSALLGSGGVLRLAPLYDLISALPYRRAHGDSKIRLCMSVGGETHARSIGAAAWRAFAHAADLRWDQVRDALVELATATPAALHDVVTEAIEEHGLDATFTQNFQRDAEKRARRCLHLLGEPRTMS